MNDDEYVEVKKEFLDCIVAMFGQHTLGEKIELMAKAERMWMNDEAIKKEDC